MLEIRLLGEQRVAVDGVTVDALRSTRALELLAYLIVHSGAPQPRRHVAGILWPDSTEAQSRTNLRRELHKLRAALPDPDACLAVDDKTVCWRDDAPCRVDVTAFRRSGAAAKSAAEGDDSTAFVVAARPAIDSYGGELLPGLYDDWVPTERDRLHYECLALVEALVAALDERGETAAAIAYARRLVELEPLEESGYRTLMRLQVRVGERAAALRTYHRCASLLERELGVSTSAGTAAVYEQLVVPGQDAGRPHQREAVPLVGRDRQLAALRQLWTKVFDGPRMVVIAGAAGSERAGWLPSSPPAWSATERPWHAPAASRQRGAWPSLRSPSG